MSESKRPESDGVRVVGAIGREFDRAIECDAQRPRRPYLAAPARRVAIACLAALVGFGLLTTPGRDAAAWVGGLVGIGEVGGPPTEKEHGLEDPGAAKSPVVIDNGQAPDGTRYEWVAYRCKFDFAEEGSPGPPLRGIGLTLEWPTVRREGGGSCEGPRGKGERTPVIGMTGGEVVPSQKRAKKPDVVFSGTVGAEAARRVRVVYRDPAGKPQDLDVDFARLDAKLRRQAGSGAPAGTFVAFLDGERASRHRLPACLGIQLSGSPTGVHQRRRCDAIYPKLRAFRLKIRRCRAQARPGQVERVARCAGRLPHPLKAIAYDANGRRLGEHAQPMSILPELSPPPTTGKPAYRGRGKEKRGRRPLHPGAAGGPVVLVRGRTPDGVPYEYFAQKFVRKNGKVYSVCLTHWFPYVKAGGGSGHCGPGFPPTRAYSKPWPRRAMVRTFGFLGDGEPATGYLSLQGFARPNVARVRVIYKDGKKGKRSAPVRFVRVRGKLRQRAGSAEPFGFFTTFLPPSIRRYYNGPGDRAKGPPAIEVIAYDDAGRAIDRFIHRN